MSWKLLVNELEENRKTDELHKHSKMRIEHGSQNLSHCRRLAMLEISLTKCAFCFVFKLEYS